MLAGAIAHSGEIVLAAVSEAIYQGRIRMADPGFDDRAFAAHGSAELVGAADQAIEQVFALPRARDWL